MEEAVVLVTAYISSVRSCADNFTQIFTLDPHNTPTEQYYYPYFQKRELGFREVKLWQSQDLNPGGSPAEPEPLTTWLYCSEG